MDSCDTGSICPSLTGLALSAAGSPVWETRVRSIIYTNRATESFSDTEIETIVAHEPTGIMTLDTETVAAGTTSPSVGLANLHVAGNQAVWTHDGQVRSAQLDN